MQGLDCYKEVDEANEMDSFVRQYSPLVNKIAHHIQNTLPGHVDFDDLLQSGLVGLLEAKHGFDENAGALFSTYAVIKIRYAIYEFIRKASGITRDISQNIKKIAKASEELGEEANDYNIAEKLGLSTKQYMEIMGQINTYKSLNQFDMDDTINHAGSAHDNPLEQIASDDFKQVLREVLLTLPKREQTILALYYNEQVSFKQIADILGYTEARISQIHTQALSKLKNSVQKFISSCEMGF